MKKISLFVLTIVTMLFVVKSSAFAQGSYWGKGKMMGRKLALAGKMMGNSLINAKVTASTGSTLTVTDNGKTYTINTGSNTVFKRRFWGKSSLSEINVGDELNISGKWTDTTKTTMSATWVRDLSIQKRFGVFWGKITALNSDNFVFQAEKRGSQTVWFDSNTKFYKRGEKSASYSDFKVGDQVKVKGEWDSALSKITQVTYVKDNSKN